MINLPTESDFEAATIDRLKLLGYNYSYGGELRENPDFSLEAVVLTDVLRRHLQARYPHLPQDAIEAAIHTAANPEGVSVLQRNMNFHRLLTRGLEVKYRTRADTSCRGDLPVAHPDTTGQREGDLPVAPTTDHGEERYDHLYLIHWEKPEANDFRVVNQLPIRGRNDRRPDLIVYINGLPLVVFELKNPYDETPTVEGAHNQIQHYAVDIPQLFDFNAFCVISDGKTSLHGMHAASLEWFAPWKSIDGRTVEPATTGSMKTLIEGIFPKDRLLDYIRHFIVFEVANEVITKKGAKYHQFFGVHFAVEQAIRATRPEGNRKIGVVWHTQGSGKSLSMIYFVGILRRRLENPTFIIQVDRNDLDEQLYDFFVAARSLVGEVRHAGSVPELRQMLRTEGGGILFTTIEKFRLQEEEAKHPVLSERRNIIVIADEAHRTQYGLMQGFAYHLRQALPNASFIGFTGTPIDLADRDTQAIFGDIIHTYDIPQAPADKAIVPIYYEPRLVRLHLVNEEVDRELEEITEGEETSEKLKARWATIEAAAGSQDRLAEIAQDLLAHYEKRSEMLLGKAMIVCMSRRICVGLYDEIVKLRPGWHHRETDKGQIKIVMTGDITKDPVAWSEAGHLTTKERREQLKARLKDPEDPPKIVIVRDMWLTGTDIPCLHTLYIDKPMKGHNLMQAIARVNRVFRDKPGGLIVDYIGIGHLLKEAVHKYTTSGFGEPTEALEQAGKARFLEELKAIHALLPSGVTAAGWRRLSAIEREDLFAFVCGHLVATDEQRDAFLAAEKRLSVAYSLVMHLPECMDRAEEVAFYRIVRAQLKKTIPSGRTVAEREQAVADLVDRSIMSEGILDIFKAAGLPKPDISVLDEKFLEEFQSKEQENLRLKLLEKLLLDEIQLRQRRNLKKYRSFKEMLEEALHRYHNNAITAAEVVEMMVRIRQEMVSEDTRKAETGLSDEELAFYDAVVELGKSIYEVPFLCDLVREIVQAVKRNLKIDWTKPHREDVKAGVKAAVKRVLRRKGIKAELMNRFLESVMEQAEARYRDWPLAA